MSALDGLLSLLATVVAITAIAVGAITWFGGGWRNKLRSSFFRLALVSGGWILTNVAFIWLAEPWQLLSALLSYAFAVLIMVELYTFSLNLTGLTSNLSRKVAIFIGVTTAVLSATPGVVAYGVESSALLTRPLALAVYACVVVGFFVAALLVLSRRRAKSSGSSRQQLDSILTGVFIAALVGLVCNLILPLFNIYSFVLLGPLGVGIFVYAISYSIVNYKLFDLRLVVVRSVAYVLSLAALGVIYFLVFLTITSVILGREMLAREFIPYIVLSLLSVIIFQPIKKFFDRLTNRIFYRDNYDEDVFIAKFTRLLVTGRDLRGLLERAANSIEDTLKTEQVSFFVFRDGSRFMTAGTEGYTRLVAKDARKLGEVFRQHPQPILVDHLESGDSVRRLLVSYKAALAFPLRRGDELLGILMLGEHRGRPYSTRDLRVLETISDELTIAIENAVATQAVKELNATLQQRIDAATDELRQSNTELQRLDQAKDDFISMASHQLRTPLTSVKGYISMVLDGDAGKVGATQKKLLSEAFASSDRMVHLINDFLNVSRLQTGKFMLERRLTDISKLVKHEVDSLGIAAKSRELDIRLEAPKSIPKLYVDEGKLRQVVMNFIDNAIYYSPSSSRIEVKVGVQGDDLIVKVEDTGIGVPESEQRGLFKKFFRASNARKQRPDGTGVGLFLAKRVIHEHGGQIIFKSKENQGSTFGFSLPIKRLSLAPRDDSD